jgi:hydrogenase maturation protease
MDVGFAMRGATRVILVDAATTGSEPGTIFRVPGEEVEDLPDPQAMNMHAFRWDNALAFARWLLKDDYPDNIEVWLVEAGQLNIGEPLSPQVEAAMQKLATRILADVTAETTAAEA